MNAPQGHPSFAQLAEIYPVSRARLHQIASRYGRAVLLDPNELAAKMLPDVFRKSRGNTLVDALTDPSERIRIAAELRQLQF